MFFHYSGGKLGYVILSATVSLQKKEHQTGTQWATSHLLNSFPKLGSVTFKMGGRSLGDLRVIFYVTPINQTLSS